MSSTENKRVIFSEMCKSYTNNVMIEVRFVCHDFIPNRNDTIELWTASYGILHSKHWKITFHMEDCPIVDSKTGERSVCFSASYLDENSGYFLKYMHTMIRTYERICYGCSTPFRMVKQLENKSSNIRSQQELMSKTNEVKDLSKRCAELEEQVKGYGAENRLLLDEWNRWKERVEELELKSSEDVLESREKTADQQVLISELNAIRSSFEAKLEESSASIAKVMSKRRDIDSEINLLRVSLEIMDRQKKMFDEWKEREQSIANEWREKECLFKTQLSDMTSRLASTSDENKKLLEQNTRLESKMDQIMNKVKHIYFETKSQTNDTITDCDELMYELIE